MKKNLNVAALFKKTQDENFLTKFEALYPRKTHYNTKEAWTLEVILATNLNSFRPGTDAFKSAFLYEIR